MDVPKLEILCLRHGKTNYSGVFPDLTEDGMMHVRHVAKTDIPEWLKKYRVSPDNLVILSSPAPRAHGTAATVMEEIHGKIILLREELGPMQWRDQEGCLAACEGLSGKGYIDYETEPVFANPELFETPSEVRARWYAFFTRYINLAFDAVAPLHCILVSHYEVFCNITHDIFGIVASRETALQYVEPISLSIALTNDPRYVHVMARFRDMKENALLDLVGQRIIRM